ncbi:CatA-like O-acetyltransferase [Lacticaseibacillus manihotivorans]|uniref:Chloramphenicol O-acetyltransferase n=2 Tax=Lacticaseibacillus manihotivorans TaxID=88233 RepID=A0A0R1QH41_9LACO|nr:CatA-like O-acetyltransferase [Lacticaseibacillus manihotivorans]KRL43822.1 chloramphenicol O-acetyltransferase [Lacticaseibacillus manihotivorans DSM 13343 = JCM 12514]QFQ91054.1 chloramphenicol acetyltransferase CAT [Lacticaseibacillus manihotivorans]
MTFTPIDMATWQRQQYFYYFTKMAPMSFTISAKIDITMTYEELHAQGLGFFPGYLYLTSKVLTTMPEFRIGSNGDGQLGYFNQLNPSYTVMHEDHTITSCWSDYTPDFKTFVQHVQTDCQAALQVNGPVGKPDQPVNSFEAGMLPWVHFDSYTPMPVNGLPSFAPVLQAGQWQVVDGRRLMPLSITANHAVADGYHVTNLLNQLQHAFNQPTWD